MSARHFECCVTEKLWLTPWIFRIRFETKKKLNYEPGQFVSIVIPSERSGVKHGRRTYSLANPCELGKKEGYELCIKLVPNGAGSNYMASLEKGHRFEMLAPYGDFNFENPGDRKVVFIANSTGVAPLKAMAQSKLFRESTSPENALYVFGARTQKDVIYADVFTSLGIETVIALSRAEPGWNGFNGRVTDYLKTLPLDWSWHTSEFYICGGEEMVDEARRILVQGRSVDAKHIHTETFFASRIQKNVA
jgi:NAD(P)H-flavin reductase